MPKFILQSSSKDFNSLKSGWKNLPGSAAKKKNTCIPNSLIFFIKIQYLLWSKLVMVVLVLVLLVQQLFHGSSNSPTQLLFPQKRSPLQSSSVQQTPFPKSHGVFWLHCGLSPKIRAVNCLIHWRKFLCSTYLNRIFPWRKRCV